MEVCPATISPTISDGKEAAGGAVDLPNNEGESGVIGHHENNDIFPTYQQPGKSIEESNPAIGEACFGPWILARRTFRKRVSVSRNQGVDHIYGSRDYSTTDKEAFHNSGGSRFTALNVNNVHDMHPAEDVADLDRLNSHRISPNAGPSHQAKSKLKPKGSQFLKSAQKSKDVVPLQHEKPKLLANNSSTNSPIVNQDKISSIRKENASKDPMSFKDSRCYNNTHLVATRGNSLVVLQSP